MYEGRRTRREQKTSNIDTEIAEMIEERRNKVKVK